MKTLENNRIIKNMTNIFKHMGIDDLNVTDTSAPAPYYKLDWQAVAVWSSAGKIFEAKRPMEKEAKHALRRKKYKQSWAFGDCGSSV